MSASRTVQKHPRLAPWGAPTRGALHLAMAASSSGPYIMPPYDSAPATLVASWGASGESNRVGYPSAGGTASVTPAEYQPPLPVANPLAVRVRAAGGRTMQHHGCRS